MAMTSQTLGTGRKVFKKIFIVEASKIEAQYKDVLGSVDSTTQLFELYKQLRGLGPARQTNEGVDVDFDDWAQLYSRSFTPVMYTKGLRYSKLMDYTNQYKDVIKKQPAFARSFMVAKNRVAANLDNLGFADTTYGMNSETLYSTSHDMTGGVTFANRPTVELAFSPLAIEQCLYEMRRQKSARNDPQPVTGKILLKLPPELEFKGKRYIRSQQLAGTNTNDINAAKDRLDMTVCDYYTSTTAWFARAVDNSQHGLFMLEQMPYDMEQLPRDKALMDTWVASESYTVGWYDPHGTWATVGA